MITQRAVAQPIHISPTRLVLMGLTGLGLVVAFIRFAHGLGAVSNMNNVYSFGLWISLDLLCGVALAAGAFTLCAVVYIFNLEEFRPLVRPSVLTGFLGYLMVIVALLVDLGRPERIWHMVIYQNAHSPLLEVGICVMTYTFVLFLEFSPVLFEGLKWRTAVRIMHSITLPLVILGVVLSTLHQSSLGSLFLVMADKLNPLWHSPLLPFFFFLSAATAGLAMVIIESSISAHAYGRALEVRLLGKLAKAIPWMLGLYVSVKVGELLSSGDWRMLFTGGLLPTLYWVELLGGVILPMVLFAIPALRRSPRALLAGALLVVAGLMLNRFDIGLIAWQRPFRVWYFPSWMEFAVSFGVISAGVLTYDWVARHLPLFADEHTGAAD